VRFLGRPRESGRPRGGPTRRQAAPTGMTGPALRGARTGLRFPRGPPRIAAATGYLVGTRKAARRGASRGDDANPLPPHGAPANEERGYRLPSELEWGEGAAPRRRREGRYPLGAPRFDAALLEPSPARGEAGPEAPQSCGVYYIPGAVSGEPVVEPACCIPSRANWFLHVGKGRARSSSPNSATTTAPGQMGKTVAHFSRRHLPSRRRMCSSDGHEACAFETIPVEVPFKKLLELVQRRRGPSHKPPHRDHPGIGAPPVIPEACRDSLQASEGRAQRRRLAWTPGAGTPRLAGNHQHSTRCGACWMGFAGNHRTAPALADAGTLPPSRQAATRAR